VTEHVLAGLEPERVWSIFEALTRIPRPSGREEKLRAWVKTWAPDHGIPFKEDETGNILLAKDASPGRAAHPALVLQAHMDMVCQSAPGKKIDFEKDPIGVRIDGGSVKADGTTLGADNGIGVAYALALLAEPGLPHGPLEALLTVNEETGFTGALGLGSGFFAGRCLLNLDSETQGEVTIGSAGGGKTEYEIPFAVERPSGQAVVAVSVSGLAGGHSGVQIHLPRLNAIKLVLDGVGEAEKVVPVRLLRFDGGSALNAIPRQAACSFLVPAEELRRAREALNKWKEAAERRWGTAETGMDIALGIPARAAGGQHEAMTQLGSEAVLSLLREIPHGPISWSRAVKGPGGEAELVRTSNNLALVESGGGLVRVGCLSRSSVEGELAQLRVVLRRIGEARGARVAQDKAYPGWSADPRSAFVRHVAACYEKAAGGPVRLTAVHAGLECGLLARLDPRLQIASIGPDIANAHSPAESVSIESVRVLWRVLIEIVKNMGVLPKR
jgi:dipeptidase D